MASTTEPVSTTGPLGWQRQRAPAVGRWPRSLLTGTSVLLVALGLMVGGTQPLPARSQPQPAPAPLLATSCAVRVSFVIVERLKPGRVAEQATIDLQGGTVATLTVDERHPTARLVVAVAHSGRYTYTLRSAAVLNGNGTWYRYAGQGSGVIDVTASRTFVVAADPRHRVPSTKLLPEPWQG
jgi:hypothetical protein